MKKVIILIITLSLGISVLYSQNEVDALRYSYTMPLGTARYTSMSGSFGALGADPSSVLFNPAGIGVYKTSDISLTPSFEINSNSANYLDRTRNYDYFGIKFNHISYIGALQIYNEDGTPPSNINFGFSYNKLNSFNESIIIDGINKENSITDYFAARANGIFYTDLEKTAYHALWSNLAYQQWLIDPVSPEDSISYISAFNGQYELRQKQFIERRGNQGEYNFALSGSIQHKLFLGMSLGIQNINYSEVKVLEEIDYYNIYTDFKSLRFQEEYTTSGTGYNFKLGFLYSPVEWLRVGAGLHTPTIFNLRDNCKNSLQANFKEDKNKANTHTAEGDYEYQLKTPLRFNASAAGIFENILINIDYELVNYAKAQLRVRDFLEYDNDTFYEENKNIDHIYKAASSIKIGGEYREGAFRFRLGFGYYESPYKSNEINKSYNTLSYSAGLGIRFEDAYIDIGYSLLTTNSLYYNPYSGFGIESPLAKINKIQNRIAITLGLKF